MRHRVDFVEQHPPPARVITRRLPVLLLSGFSLLACVSLVWLSIRSGDWHGRLTLRREVAKRDVHTLRMWKFDFGRAVTFTSTWYYEDHLLPVQIAVLKEEIARWPAVLWEQWTKAEVPSYVIDRPIGPFREEWPSGSVDRGFSVRYGTLIVLFAVLPALLVLRGTARTIATIRCRNHPLGPARPAGRKVTVAAASSFLLLLLVSVAWLESEVSGLDAQRVWVIAIRDDGTHCGSFRLVSLRGELHVAYAKGGPELRFPIPSENDPYAPLWKQLNHLHWQGGDDDWVLGPTHAAPAAQEEWHGRPDLRVGSIIDQERDWVEVIASYWLPWTLCLPLPLYWLARRRGWVGRRADGLCASCGYDLRASSTRCPECGAPITPRTLPPCAMKGRDRNVPAAM